MPRSQELIHFEKENNQLLVQLRRFVYPGAFYAYVVDEFNASEYSVSRNDTEKCKEIFMKRNKIQFNFIN